MSALLALASRRLVRRALPLLALALLALCVTLARHPPGSLRFPLLGDGHYYFLQMHSLLVDADLQLDNQRAAFGDPLREWDRDVTRGLGNTLLWGPFFGLGAGLATLLDYAPVRVALFAAWGCEVGTWFYLLLAACLLYRLPSFARVAPALRAALLVALCASTPLWRYASTLPHYNHVLTFFLAACIAHACDRERTESPIGPLGLGLTLGVSLITRPELCMLALPLLRSLRRARASAFVRAGVLAAAVLLLQGLAMWQAQRSLMPPGFLELADPWLLETWFGPRNGFFVHQPLLAIAVVAFAAQARRPERLLACVAALLFAWVQAAAWDVWGGFGYGARRLVPLLPFAYVGLCEAASRPWRRPRVALAVLAPVVAWATWHGHSALSQRRALAILEARVPAESAYERSVGIVTSAPFLAARAWSSGIGLEEAYRIAHRAVLEIHFGAEHGVEALRPDAERTRDLLVRARGGGGTSFILPVGRTALCGLGVRAAAAPAVLRIDGVPSKAVSEVGGYRVYIVEPKARSHWLRIDAQGTTAATEWVLDSRCELYR